MDFRMKWNSDRTLALVEYDLGDDNEHGLPYAVWIGRPKFVQTDDLIGGLYISTIARAEHRNQPAFRFGLCDEHGMGSDDEGRLILVENQTIKFTRYYVIDMQLEKEVEQFEYEGYQRLPARAVLPGDLVKTVGRDESHAGTVVQVEIVPAEVRGCGETGLAIDIDTLSGSFLDCDLDEIFLVKR